MSRLTGPGSPVRKGGEEVTEDGKIIKRADFRTADLAGVIAAW